MSITALTRKVDFSQYAGALQKGSGFAPFFSFPKSSPRISLRPALQRFRVPQELWTAVSITALTTKVVFSQDAGALQKGSGFTPFSSFPKSSPRISLHPKAAILAALQRLRVPQELWSAVSITALTRKVDFSQDAGAL